VTQPYRPPAVAPARGKVLWWGFTGRCARCGSGHLFRGYFHMVADCPRCGLHFEREQGYFAGALAINIMATGGLFVVAFALLLAFTIPNVPVLPTILVLFPIVALGPVVYYPFSKTVWVAIDRAFLLRLDPNERADGHR
jgi:uncharacterized protein (DUF983 family)